MSTSIRRPRTRKGLAIAAAGAVVAVGTLGTLAAWNDNEWVVGAVNGDRADEGVGTLNFEVRQNREQSPANLDANFVDDLETNPEAGALQFGIDALNLTPGDTLYAPVALRTVPGSLGGDVRLQAPVAWDGHTASDADGLLWGALLYSVRTTKTPTACDESTWATFGSDVIINQPLTNATGAVQRLGAAASDVQYYCFAITLPTTPTLPDDDDTTVDDLQGRTVSPAWRFAVESVDPA